MNKGQTFIHTIGLDSYRSINQHFQTIVEQQRQFHQWLEDIVTDCKAAFEKPDIRLLPKTPTVKRSKKKTKKRDSSDVFEQPSKKSLRDNDETDVEEEQPRRRPQRRAASRTVSSSSSKASQTRKKKKVSGDGPQLSITKVIEKENSEPVLESTPENDRLHIPKSMPNVMPIKMSPLRKHTVTGPCMKKAGPGHVKDKVLVFEDLMELSSPTTPQNNSCTTTPKNNNSCSTTPVTQKKLYSAVESNLYEETIPVPETPEQNNNVSTPDTVKGPEKQVLVSSVVTPSRNNNNPSNVTETPNTTLTPLAHTGPKERRQSSRRSSTCRRSRRTSRASLRKSLKMIASQSKLEMTKLRSQLQIPAMASTAIVNQDSPSTEGFLKDTATTERKVVHTKLKLKKKEIPVDDSSVVSSQQLSKTSNSSGGEENDNSASCQQQSNQSDKVLDTPKTSCNEDEWFYEEVVQNLKIVYVEDSDIEQLSDIDDVKKSDPDSEACEKNNAGRKRGRSTFNAKDINNEVSESSPLKEKTSPTDVSSDTASVNKKPVCANTRTKQRKNTATSSVSSNDDLALDRDSGLGKDSDITRSTRSKMRKPNAATSSVDDSDADDERMAEEEVVPVRQSTRTKQRKQTASTASTTSDLGDSSSEPPLRTSSRTKQRKNTAALSASSADDEVMEVDGNSQIRQSTRSKARKPRAAPMSVSSDEGDDPFLMPDAPPMRSTRTKTRKRQLDEDNSADESISKKSCTEHSISQVEDSFEQLERLCNSSADFSNREISTPKSSDNSDTGSAEKLTPSAKPPSFVNNLSKVLPPSALSTGIMKSFIKNKNSPAKLTIKEQQELRKKELSEKQKKDEQRLQQRDALLKIRIEEQRKKREERMKKAADQRQLLQKHDIDLKNKLQRQREEKLQQTENLREEKMREEREKQRIRLKKMQEAEERRKLDEEERLRKLKEQEEEEKRLKDLQAKKKEQEQRERQRLILEERRRQEERAAQVERERQAEQERLKLALEEERQKEAERQRLREQREKAAALAQAEKERLELEKRKERELQLKKNLEKQKEMARKQQEKWDKQKEEQKRQAAELQNLIAKHNASVTAPTQVKKAPLPKPTFINTTQNMSQSTNSDSYEMTPVRKYSRNSDNYDITDMKSDDSTDDDEKPRRKIPAWAQGPNLKASLINQHYHPPNLPQLFGPIDPPDLNLLFNKKKARFNKRTSSAHWDSPIMKPGTTFLN
ncbi:inner centromere protein A-like [Ylistrum balloti]|uniref:inner centromere protein A-like n=1 Tax=Ylistrum balloti TaxID=509963 RepID=UPI002905E7B2|nr:inner centromere protein A-like [Ylistrum balloti]